MMSKYSIDPTAFDGGLNTGMSLDPQPAETTARRSRLKIFVGVAAAFIICVAIGGYFYWQSLKRTPQYSLALLVDAARRDDQAAIDSLMDSDAAVDDFVPQVTAKAIELYGRGLPPETLARVERIATPLLPAVKGRARDELPRLIRDKTAAYRNVPFAAMVLGADRYLDIQMNGNEATVKSKLPEHSFEMRMTRSGDRWKVVGVRDEKLATAIAQKIGQEIIAIASSGHNGTPQSATFKDFQDVLKRAQDIFKN